jgi:hypothetical protein
VTSISTSRSTLFWLLLFCSFSDKSYLSFSDPERIIVWVRILKRMEKEDEEMQE